MSEIAGCTLIETIARNPYSLVYRARNIDHDFVIVKILAPETADSLRIASFRNEFDLISSIQSDLIAKTISIEEHDNLPVMIMEDIGGISLKSYIKRRRRIEGTEDLQKALELSLLIVKGLSSIHHENIIHKDLTPSNIIYNDSSKRLNIIDFSRATKLSYERLEQADSNSIEGTLAYISPEQTGRMNRQVDYRSDYYSLGISLYELFSQELPFQAETPRAWVHSHTAKTATPLHVINRHIPILLSAIVMKLMAKNAEERYQSSYCLYKDLEYCLKNISEPNKLQLYTIGSNDVSKRFKISQKLYGRQKEFEILKKQIDKAPYNSPTSIFVKGSFGMGKSLLVGEIAQYVLEKKGIFISGKFEENWRNIPYSAIIKAFSGTVQNVLTEDPTETAKWKAKLCSALGNDAQLIVDIIPELKLIIGEQNALATMPTREANYRFRTVFLQFANAFCNESRPCVLFLDDLQWADAASITMVSSLLKQQERSSLLFIGAFRPIDMPSSDQTRTFLQTLKEIKPEPIEIKLDGLELDEIKQLIRDSFHSDEYDTEALAALCKEYTQGNPLFINEFITNFHHQGFIKYNEKFGKWDCDHPRMANAGVTENVADFISERVNKLPPLSQNLLKIASCFGYGFDTKLLGRFIDTEPKKILLQMELASEQRLIQPLDEKYRYAAFTEDATTKYKFIHDKVMHTAYNMLTPENRTLIHIKIGRFLLESYDENKNEEALFIILSHLNPSAQHLSRTEQINLCRLNLLASHKAKASGATDEALQYAHYGLSLLEEKMWETHYKLCYTLYKEAADLTFYANNNSNIKKLIEDAEQHCQSKLERAELKEILILSHIANHDQPEALKEAFQALELLGIVFPKKIGKAQVILELFRTRNKLIKGGLGELQHKENSNDPSIICASRILASIFSAAFYVQKYYFPYIVVKIIDLSFEYGILPKTPVALVSFGMVLNAINRPNYDLSFEISKVGMKLFEKTGDQQSAAQLCCLHQTCIRPWKENLHSIAIDLKKTSQLGLDNGDSEFGVAAAVAQCSYLFFSGLDLRSLAETAEQAHTALELTNQKVHQAQLDVITQTIKNFTEEREEPDILMFEGYGEGRLIRQLTKVADLPSSLNFYLNKLILAVYFNKTENMMKYIQEGRKCFDNSKTIIIYSQFVIFEALALLRIYPELSWMQKAYTKRRVSAIIKEVKRWMSNAPMNFASKYFLILAEQDRVFKKGANALRLYGNAVENAHLYKLVQDEALAHELCGMFAQQNQCQMEAKIHFQMAYINYKRWGAMAKAHQLESKTSDTGQTKYTEVTEDNYYNHTEITSNTLNSDSDLKTVFEVAQTLSSQKNYNALIEKAIEIIIQQACAEKAILLLYTMETDTLSAEVNAFYVKNKLSVKQEPTEVTDAMLAAPIIRRVKRTEKTELQADASKQAPYAQNTYVIKNKVKSVLAIPLKKQSQLLGIIYLENNTTTDAFNEKQINLLEMLSSLVAISIENARLYQSLEQIVDERTAELTVSNEKLKESNTTKDMFFQLVSHDLKSPLGSLSSLIDTYEEETDEEMREELHTMIKRQVKTNYEQLETLLLWTRSQKDEIKFNPSILNMKAVADEAIKLHISGAKQKQIRVENNIDESLNAFCDHYMIKTVLINLIGNAIKFTHEYGLIQISALIEGQTLSVEVADNGLGMNNNTIEGLFNVKTKPAGRAGTNNEKGTGLGLILCSEFIEKHHKGRIFATSEEGKGSKFTFILPHSSPSLLPVKKSPDSNRGLEN